MVVLKIFLFLIVYSGCFISLANTLIYSYRLSGGTQTNNGYVEVLYLGTWYLLCGSSLSSSDAAKICESIGHVSPGTVVSSVSGFTKPQNSAKVTCSGFSGLAEVCVVEAPIVVQCSHSQGIVIQCSDPTTTTVRTTSTAAATTPTTTEGTSTTSTGTSTQWTSTTTTAPTVGTEITATATPAQQSATTTRYISVNTPVTNNQQSNLMVNIPDAIDMTTEPMTITQIQSQCSDFDVTRAVPPNRGKPNQLEFNFEIFNLHYVNVVDRVISVGALILMHWTVDTCRKDSSTVFSEIDRQPLYVPNSDTIWKPKLRFMSSADSNIYMNGANFGTDVVAQLRIDGDYQIIDFYYLIYGKFDSSCPMALENFPLDEQTCTLEFDLSRPASILQIPTENVSYHWLHAYNDEWKNKNGAWSVTTKKFGGQTVYGVQFDITVTRNPQYYVVYLALPVLILGLVSIVSFVLPSEQPDRPLLSMTVLLALYFAQTEVLNRLPVIESSVLLGTYVIRMIILTVAINITQLIILFMAINIKPLNRKLCQGKVSLINIIDLVLFLTFIFCFVIIHVLAHQIFQQLFTNSAI